MKKSQSQEVEPDQLTFHTAEHDMLIYLHPPKVTSPEQGGEQAVLPPVLHVSRQAPFSQPVSRANFLRTKFMYTFSVTREVQKRDVKFELEKPVNTPFRFQVGHKARRTWQSQHSIFPLSVRTGVISCRVEVVLACPCSLLNTFLDYCNLQHLTDFSKNRNSFTSSSFCVKTSTSFTLQTGQIVSKCRICVAEDGIWVGVFLLGLVLFRFRFCC